jgi:hypothetical protein
LYLIHIILLLHLIFVGWMGCSGRHEPLTWEVGGRRWHGVRPYAG